MKLKCPSCQAEIFSANINIQTDVAQCQQCSNIFKISELISEDTNELFSIDEPPKGAWIHRKETETIVGATTRSPIAFFLVPFMLVWSGGSLGGIYGSQIISGEFDPFMSLFGIPFIIGSIIFWSLALMAVAGKVEITFNEYGGKIFTGFSKIGYSRKFRWDEINTVSESDSRVRYPGGNGASICLEGKKRIAFGTGLNTSRKYYILMAFKSILRMQKKG